MATSTEKGSVSVRPAKEVRPRLIRLAAELGRSEGQLINECAEAIVALVEESVPMVPQLVTMARTLRKHGATLLDPPRPFPKHTVLPSPRSSADVQASKSRAVAGKTRK